MEQKPKIYANVILRVEITQPITSKEKEELLFSMRDRIKSSLSCHDIDEYRIIFQADNKNQ